jgi:hypothetical protein
MKAIEHQVEINWPLQALFNYVSDLTNNAAWQRQVVHAEWIGNGKNASGARFVEKRNVLGRECSATVEVTEFERFKRRTLAVVDGPCKQQFTMEFEPRGDTTLMKLILAFETENILDHGANLPFRNAHREVCDNLVRLKNILESSD